MAAPKNNQFWKLRAKHGREKIFSDPEILWKCACEYFEATDKRKWKRKDWVGKDAYEVEREMDTPYTITGLCLYLGCSYEWWKLQRKREDEGFMPIITRIEEIIYTQKFEGAAVGVFNQNIIARDLGLVDKKELTENVITVEVKDE